MLNLVSSRAAALKLALVVLALLIPTCVLGLYLGKEINFRLAQTRGEAKAIALAQNLVPGYFSASAGNMDRPGMQATAESALADPGNEYVRSDLEAFAESLNNPADTQADFAELGKLIEQIYYHSPLSAEAEKQTFELAAVALKHMPAMLQERSTLASATASPAEIQQSFGRLVQTAQQSQKSLEIIAASLPEAAQLSTRLAAVAEDVSQDAALGQAMTEAVAQRLFLATEDAYQFTASQLAKNIAARESEISGRRTLVLVLSLASIAVGLVSALLMFKSSLVRLDDLSSAKTEADTARQDAEDMNSRLKSINNEIISLNSELADKMQRLKEAQDELLRKGRMEQLGQLTATVAHELRNPLGAVRTSAFLLERKLKGKGLSVEPQLQRINNGITRCDSIITQLLDFSRTKQVVASPANLDEWLANVVEEEARRIPAAVAIECNLGLGSVQVPFDPARLQRAVINLISNAAEAMVGTGDDPAKFTSQKPAISISTRTEETMAVIEVEDNGPGIPYEIMSKIREPLFTTKSFGTGLGIPAVEQIVVQHGGKLEITSEPGQGAKFSVILPLHRTQAEAA